MPSLTPHGGTVAPVPLAWVADGSVPRSAKLSTCDLPRVDTIPAHPDEGTPASCACAGFKPHALSPPPCPLCPLKLPPLFSQQQVRLAGQAICADAETAHALHLGSAQHSRAHASISAAELPARTVCR